MDNMYDELPAGVDPNLLEEYLNGSPTEDSDEEEESFTEDYIKEHIAQSSGQASTKKLSIERVKQNNVEGLEEVMLDDEEIEENCVTLEDPISQQAVELLAMSTVNKNKRKWKKHFVRDEKAAPKKKTAVNSDNKPRKRSRKDLFSPEEKKILATEVKKNPAIWDITSHDHSNSNALSACWKRIAAVLNRSEEDCKIVWTSLRESYRYREKTQKAKASGSEGGEPIAIPSHQDSANDWELINDLSFLPDTSKKRKTITSFHGTNVQNDGENTESTLSQGNYSYLTRNCASSNPYEESVSQLANNVGELIQIQKSLTPQQPQQFQSTLVHHVALANIDRMLQNLPANEIEDTLFEMTNFIYEKIKNTRDNNV